MKFKLHIFVLLASLLIGCSAKNEMASNDDRKPDLVIISTNDIHSNIDRIPKLAAFTKLQREENNNVILLDAGDRQNGNAIVDYADLPGRPIIEIMNLLGYNVATLGDHEFDYGQEALAQNIAYANFDIVCANISKNSVMPELEPYKYINIGKRQIAIMGLINVDKTTHQPPALANKLNDLSFEDPAVTAKQFRSLTQRADMLIALSHCGSYTDSVISSYVPEMDLIIGGGSHEAIFNPKEINGVLITQAGNGLKYAGITKVWFNKNNVVCKNSLVDLDDYNDDEEFKIILNNIKSRKDFSKVIGYNNTDMDKTSIASILCKSMIRSSKCSYGLYNIDGINRELQSKGAITLEDLYNIEPYKYKYYNLNISIKTLEDIIYEEYNSRLVKDRKKRLHIEGGLTYVIAINNDGNLMNVIFYDGPNIIPDYSIKITIAVSEHIYITYQHLIGDNNNPQGVITDSVIDYYK